MLSTFYHTKFRLLGCCVMLLFGASCNPVGSRIASGHDAYAFSTNALLIEQMDRTLVVCIKRHGDAYSYRERHGSATKAMESTYYLQNSDAANMRRVAQRGTGRDACRERGCRAG